jgi:hypothetical protein
VTGEYKLKRETQFCKNTKKILKGQSEAINRRQTDSTMAKIKRTKGQATIYKTLHRKKKIEQHEPHSKLVIEPPVFTSKLLIYDFWFQF